MGCMGKKKVLTIVGARPQFIKMAPVSRIIRKRFKEVVVHTGQHYDYNMSYNFFTELNLPAPDYNLRVKSLNPGQQVGRMLAGIESIIIKERPHLVLVYGDTNSTLAGALAAAKAGIALAHVESGLRSFNRAMPEEINRVMTDHISDILFCPTAASVINLKREGITKNVFLVGDVMRDSLCFYLSAAARKSSILAKLKLEPKKYNLLTIHRAENTLHIKDLKNILWTMDNLDMPIVFPMHPRTKEFLKSSFRPKKRLLFIQPVSYFDMLILEKNANVIFTDSGGVQKEAYFLKVPCITLRQETEWPETVKDKANQLVGTNSSVLMAAVKKIETTRPTYNSKPFGDGKTSNRIVELLEKII